MFMTAEYRRGLIRVTLAATPRRGRVLAAKAVVIAAVTFAVGLASSAIVVTRGPAVAARPRRLRLAGHRADRGAGDRRHRRRARGRGRHRARDRHHPAAQRRRGRGRDRGDRRCPTCSPSRRRCSRPARPTGWPGSPRPPRSPSSRPCIQYPQVNNAYVPSAGYYPLPPWAGLAVLCGWAAVALALAVWTLNRRDA